MQATRRERVLKTHLLRDKLSLADRNYLKACEDYFELQLKLDMPSKAHDVTSELAVSAEKEIKVEFIMKEEGIIAGTEEVICFLKRQKGVNEAFSDCIDGEFVKKGRRCLFLKGNARVLLRLERVLVNFLQRMSGIATYTYELAHNAAQINPYTLLCPTRKTLNGPLDKKAVMLAEGGTHRVYLSDAILIKENHLAASDYDLGKLLAKLLTKRGELAFIEVEVESEKQALEVCKILHDLKKVKNVNRPLGIMFDNFMPAAIQSSLEKIRELGFYDEFFFEASGGINEQNLEQYVKTGVDIISLGALTNKARPLDVSMLLS